MLVNKLRLTHIAGLLLLVLLFAGCGSSPTKTTAPEQAGAAFAEVDQALFDQALAKLKDGQYQKAQKDLKILLTRRQDVGEVWINYAVCLYQLDKKKELGSALRGMEKQGIERPERYNLQGLLAVEQGAFTQAAQHYTKAIKLDKNYANAWYNLALVYDVYLQDVPSAVEYYKGYLALVPDDEEAKNWLEHLQYSMGEL